MTIKQACGRLIGWSWRAGRPVGIRRGGSGALRRKRDRHVHLAGTLTVRGENLHIEKLSFGRGGDLKVEGSVDALNYEDEGGGGGFFARLFR